jgi:hypothetical protein
MCRQGEPEGRLQAGHQARLHRQGMYTAQSKEVTRGPPELVQHFRL